MNETTAREAVVAAGRDLVGLGLSPGTSGNVSARSGDRLYLSPTNVALGALAVDELAVLSLDGDHLDGPRPSKEWPLHRALYRRDPATAAVVHLHSQHAAAVSCLPPWSPASAIGPITPYFVMRVGQTPMIDYASPGDPGQAGLIEKLDLPFRAVLLANHGPVIAHTDLPSAVSAAVELEEACKLTLLTAGQNPRLLPPAECRALAGKYGSPWTAES
jgi:3-dehydro-4-phosphotetronate decarboxylase